jgi:molybdopterin-guanine dinucleotide biosynthesis protein MobB
VTRVRAPILAVSGPSGSGKTRLLRQLIPALARRGVAVAVLKHTRHVHAFDRPGKDTEVLRRAGAVAAAIDGPAGMALFGPPAGGLRALARLLPEVDLVLAEGFRGEPVPRLEVHRRSVSREFLCAGDRRVLAVVTDEPPPRPIRAFTDGDVEAIAELVCDRFGLGARVGGARELRVRPGVSTLRADQSERKAALGRSDRMAKTTNRKSGARGGSRTGGRSSSRRGGRSAAGRKGGNATLRSRGPEFYSEIGRKGGRSRSRNARRTASSRGRSGGRGGTRRSGTGGRGGSRSSRKGGTRSMRRSSR